VWSPRWPRAHGADGAGSMDGPQVLSPVRDFATFTIRNGRDTRRAVELIAAYVATLPPGPGDDDE